MAIQIDNGWWLEVNEAARFEGVTRREIELRINAGPEEKFRLLARPRKAFDGRRGRMIYEPSLSYGARERFKAERLRNISAAGNLELEVRNENPKNSARFPQPTPSSILDMPAPEGPTTPRSSGADPALKSSDEGGVASDEQREQGRLWPQTELDRKIAALDVRESQRAVVLSRFRVIRPLVNHDYKALGYGSKTAFIAAMAKQIKVSRNTIWRWYGNYAEHEDLSALANELPGPAATGIGSKALDLVLDVDDQAVSARAFLKDRWLAGLLKKQIYRDLLRYLTEKQRGCGAGFLYRLPSETTVYRFVDSLDALEHARRQGEDAVKQALGYIDRRYDDLRSLGVVEVDETKINAYGYLEGRQYKVLRFWIVTFYDRRSIYPLVWDLIGAPENAKKLHGITQRDELRLFEQLVRDYGLPGKLYSDRGRFRGKFWGYEAGGSSGHSRESGNPRDTEFAVADGLLEQLRVGRGKPREKNPRASRLERFHRFLADQARKLPGWVGGDIEEKEMTPGEQHKAEHLEYVAGRRPTTPLLSRSELLAAVSGWMEEWRSHPSDGTDMNGLSPRAAFLQNRPAEGFRQPLREEAILLDSEIFPKVKIHSGGIAQLPDGKRYGLPGEIVLEQGQRRDVLRQRSDLSVITLLPDRKGHPKLTARLRPRVGTSDPAALAQAVEFQSKLRKLEGQMRTLRQAEPPVPADPRPTSGDVARRALELEEETA